MKKLYLSRKNKMLAGVCGGLGEMLDIDPTIIRLIFVFVGIVSAVFPLLIAYIIGWIIIPENPDQNITGIQE
ncbi:MAG: PspC domain-containing protein [Calditrichaceae bacterium]